MSAIICRWDPDDGQLILLVIEPSDLLGLTIKCELSIVGLVLVKWSKRSFYPTSLQFLASLIYAHDLNWPLERNELMSSWTTKLGINYVFITVNIFVGRWLARMNSQLHLTI